MSTRRHRYDIALNGQGLVLASKPETPKLLARQDDIFGQRFAQGDRDYNDLAKWWYMAQTDWSGGFKDTVKWLDDAKYYYSTNIDTYSEPGAIKLTSGLLVDNDFTENIVCGCYESPSNTVYTYIGTDATGSTKPAIYRRAAANNWTDISSAFMPTTQQAVMDIMSHKGSLWFITTDTTSGGTYEVGYCTDSGGSPVDLSANLLIAPRHVFCMDSDGTTLYVGYRGTSNQAVIEKTTDKGATWSAVVALTASTAAIPCLCIIGSSVYYLATKPNGIELRLYNNSADSLVWFWPNGLLGNSSWATIAQNTQSNTSSVSRKVLLNKGGKLIITLQGEIWEWNYESSIMTELFKFDGNKYSIDSANNANPLIANLLNLGPIIHDNKIWWNNLIYDGVSFYNNKRIINDSDGDYLNPIFSNGSIIYWVGTGDRTKVYIDSSLKGTADKNYIVFNNFDKVSVVDKLAYSVDLIFKKLVTGNKIAVEYMVGELTGTTNAASDSTGWQTLGSASFTADGAITQKTLYFGDAVLFKKIWFRVKLEGSGSNTPVLYDFVLTYLPMPDYRLKWDFTVKCEDEIQRKDQSKEPKSGIWLRNMLQKSWLTKSILTFEDFDASAYDSVSGSLTATGTTITVTNNTDQFPEAGRIVIGTEEIFYTGKTKKTFTGCSRGARGTNKVAHSDTAPITMEHRVIIRNYQEELIIANEPTKAEYLVTLTLSEV